MKSWLLVFCLVILFTVCCVADTESRSAEHVSQFVKDFKERNKGIVETAKDYLSMSEKSIIDAFNQVSTADNKRKNLISGKSSDIGSSVADQEKESPKGFWYGLATVVRTIPMVKDFFSSPPTREELKAKIEEEAEMDAIHTARMMKQHKQAREAARIRLQEKWSQKKEQKLVSRDDDQPLCNLGREEKSLQTINSCSTYRECVPLMFSSPDVPMDTPAEVFVGNTSVEVTQLRCGSFPVSFLDDYDASKCFITAIACNSTTPIGECPVEVRCEEPSPIVFSFDGRYAFSGQTDVLYCNDVEVEDMSEYINKTLPDECEVRSVLSAINGTCYRINTTESVQVTEFSCSSMCYRNINETHCRCPADYTGTYCENTQNVTCQAFLVSPLPDCFVRGEDNLLVYDKPCLFADSLTEATITMLWNVSCKFDWTLRGNTADDGFTYWLNTPDLKLSAEPNWTVSLEAFQFSTFVNPISLESRTKLSLENLAGKEPVTLRIKPTEEYVVGGRLYTELSFAVNHTPPGFTSGVLRRFFLDEVSGGFGGGNGKNLIIKEGLSPGEIAIIIIASIVAVAIIAGIVRYFYERWKEAKIHEEEVAERNNKKQKKD